MKILDEVVLEDPVMAQEIIITSVIGGLLCLDAAPWGQFMVSRPIVAGPLVGLVLGDMRTGAIVGALLELIWLNVISVGAAIPPEPAVVTIVSTALIIFGEKTSVLETSFPGSYRMFVLMLTMPLGEVFRIVDVVQRRLNAHFVHYVEKEVDKGNFFSVSRVTYLSLLFFFLKGLVLSLLTLALGSSLFPWLFSLFPDCLMRGLDLGYRMLPALGLATALNAFSNF